MITRGIATVSNKNFMMINDRIVDAAWEFCSTDCYSTVDDLACRKSNVGNSSDEIFFGEGCVNVTSLCGGESLIGVNASFCRNETAGVDVPISEIFVRVLSTEEFF